MLSFSEFLIEGLYNPLYHGTSFSNVFKILKDGHIEPSSNGYTSLSRSKKVVSSTYGQKESYFKFDREKIKNNSKITPTDWHMGGAVKDDHFSEYKDPSLRRADAEEAVKGAVSLKHATELVIHKKHWDYLHKPETEEERQNAAEVKREPSTAWLYKGLTYKDRVKQKKNLYKLLSKHPHIKVSVRDY